jgi:predicted nucleic acid-binding Zn ribbon protein
MPVYTYRREDGTTFDYRQKFLDDPLEVDPATGQHVVRVMQPAGIIFKGSGFYINDSKSASRSSINNTAKPKEGDTAKSETTTASDSKAESKTEAKAETKPEAKAETKTAAAD